MTERTNSYINLEYMNLMADGDEDMKKTMLEMLLDELPAEIAKIVNLSTSGDLKTLKAVSHKLKSTLAFVGNETLNQTNKNIENIAIEEGDIQLLQNMAKAMQDCCDLVLRELRIEFNKL